MTKFLLHVAVHAPGIASRRADGISRTCDSGFLFGLPSHFRMHERSLPQRGTKVALAALTWG